MRPVPTAGVIFLALALCASRANADPLEGEPTPPPINTEALHYGVAFALESIASGGNVCPAADGPSNCILGSGFGLGIRVGYRSRPWLFAGVYEFSRQQSANLLRLAILQQLRGEARYYYEAGNRATTYVVGGLGPMVYGDEWGVESGGAVGSLGLGIEYEVSATTLVGAALAYRPLLFRSWTDDAGVRRANGALGFGFAHSIALEVTFEQREVLPRW
ncbi:MAG: hypothetical protein SFV15_04220 [Polyangiaceae bacterium]|nr:hypothetical protein [Polyangiaceae bacterium]